MADKEMELLLSEQEMTINGKKVVIKKIALLDTIRIASKISDVVARILGNPEAFDGILARVTYAKEGASEEEINGVRITGLIDLFGLIGEDSVDIIKYVIEKSTTLTADEAEEVDCLEGIDLVTEIYKVNKSFFAKCWSKLGEKNKKKSSKKTK